ncbi:hypothetical protein Lepto7375DRAFT_5967 [Leptolyngbya sp. PCC 7375]|nr:hypothetical protein Lepto7375DRAFT_5967 [Leptolyngbya sp. PCC 7375]
MASTLLQKPDRVVLQNISWQIYQSLSCDFEYIVIDSVKIYS